MKPCTERIYNGVIKENPTLVLMLGMCPTLAVTTSAVRTDSEWVYPHWWYL